MMRQRLENMSLNADLKKEIGNYGITNIPKTRAACLDVLLTHLERNGPLEEAQITLGQKTHDKSDLPGSSVTGTMPKNTTNNTFLVNEEEEDVSTECLPQMYTLLIQQMSKQNE